MWTAVGSASNSPNTGTNCPARGYGWPDTSSFRLKGVALVVLSLVGDSSLLCTYLHITNFKANGDEMVILLKGARACGLYP